MFRSLLVLFLLLPGCAAIKNAHRVTTGTPADAQLPPDFAQPRLAEVLDYMAGHGVEEAGKASIFTFSAWPMYRALKWDDHPRKPRFEGAQFEHAGLKVIVAISPVEPWTGEEKLVPTHPRESDQTTGAAILLPHKTWSISFTLEKPDPALQEQYTTLLREFLQSWSPATAQLAP